MVLACGTATNSENQASSHQIRPNSSSNESSGTHGLGNDRPAPAPLATSGPLLAWSQRLLAAPLGELDIRASNIQAAWTQISQSELIRSVLYSAEGLDVAGDFHFTGAGRTVKDLFDALTSAFPSFIWRQDEATGVLWIHPRTANYRELLNQKIEVKADHLGMPMFDGILLPMVQNPALGLVLGARATTGFLNTFNFPVTVGEGAFAVRDIINQICAANPTKSFYLQKTGTTTVITPFNLVDASTETWPIGAVVLWEQLAGRAVGDEAEFRNGMLEYLADPEPGRRRMARWILEARVWHAGIDQWIKDAARDPRSAWLALAASDVLVRGPDTTQVEALELMRSQATGDLLQRGDAVLAVSVAFELARLSDSTSALQALADRRFGEAEIAALQRNLPFLASLVRRSPRLSSLATKDDKMMNVLSFLNLKRFAVENNRLRFEADPAQMEGTE